MVTTEYYLEHIYRYKYVESNFTSILSEDIHYYIIER